MKKYFLLFALFFIVAAVKAQVKPTYFELDTNFLDYTDNDSSGEGTYTSARGDVYTLSWSVVGTTLSWDVSITAASGHDVGLHYFYIQDDNDESNYFAYDDFEDTDYGTDYWHYSGSTDIGSAANRLHIYWDSLDDTQNNYLQFTGMVYYHQPL